MKSIVEFLSFDKDPVNKIFGYVRVRLFKRMIAVFPVIQRRDGDFYIANPSKSVNVMGQWKQSEMLYFEQKEDREQFSSLAKDFVMATINANRPPVEQKWVGNTNVPPHMQNASMGQNTQNSQNGPVNFGKWADQQVQPPSFPDTYPDGTMR